jgi:DinB superfamily
LAIIAMTGEKIYCSECGFDWDGESGNILCALTDATAEISKAFEHSNELTDDEFDRLIRVRPSPEVWSIVEYLAHLRDVFSFYSDRIELVLTNDRPELTTRDFDELARTSDYRNEDPTRVLGEIEAIIVAAGNRLATLQEEQWARIGIGSSGKDRTVLVLARRIAHENQHHLLDIRRVRKLILERHTVGE